MNVSSPPLRRGEEFDSGAAGRSTPTRTELRALRRHKHFILFIGIVLNLFWGNKSVHGAKWFIR